MSAAAGDTIVVGPGVYGDLNHNGTLGDLPGEENPDVFSPGCGCVLALNKPVSVESSNGAAATIIDGQSVDVGTNVLVITGLAGGGEFGKPGKGFTVTNTGSQDGNGITIDATNVTVAGNQVVSSMFLSEIGIATVNADETVRIEGNQVIGWGNTGILTQGAGKTIRGNQVSKSCGRGIEALGTSVVVGNVASGNGFVGGAFVTGAGGSCHGIGSSGIAVGAPGTVVLGNAAYGNDTGIEVGSAFAGTIGKNNLVGNDMCGLRNEGVVGLQAPNNYWGAATGPGAAPADDICNENNGTTTVTSFATKPFTVKAPIKP